MKKHIGLPGLLMVPTAVLLTQPVWAAATQVTAVRVTSTNNGGVQLVLETQGGERPQIFTLNRRNAFIADITNAQLRLPEGRGFSQEKPADGIASVVVTQLDAESIRVTVTGVNNPPAGEITSREPGKITLSLNPKGTNSAPATPAAQTPATTPTLAQAPAAPATTAQTPTPQPPAGQRQDILVPNPQITYEGGPPPAPAAGAVQPQNPAPPFLPRAVAPPVGDIAVSELDSSSSIIDLGTSERIPRLLLRDAPVREVLSLLARASGQNVVFVAPQTTGQQGQQAQQGQQGQAPAAALSGTISLDIENEPLQDVFNTVLRITGLQANRQGRTIFVGSNLPEAAANIVVRSLRLNQVPVASAANFLTAQGAETQLPIERVQIQTIGEGAAARTVEIREPDIKVLRAQRGNGPLILSGLSVLADSRLNAITLVGDPRKVEIASAFLSQLDARRRQVAVNVKIVDVNLNNTDIANTSFSFGVGGGFFTFDQGAAAVSFGGVNPPAITDVTNSVTSPPVISTVQRAGGAASVFPGTAGTPDPFNDAQPEAPFSRSTGAPIPSNNPNFPFGNLIRSPFGTNQNPLQPGINAVSGNPQLPQLFQFPTRFLSLLQAQITSGNAKILTDPTLVIQEGETANLNLGQEVVSNRQVQTQTSSGGTTVTENITKETAGVTLQIQVNRIDDNGFVTINVNPTVTVPYAVAQASNGSAITLLNRRDLRSGLIRLRDGQTLIVSGIIQDQDRTTVRKVPILGDIPILGALFRSTNRQNTRQEVIALLTPQVLDDSAASPFGYRYRPSPEVQQLLQQRGFSPQPSNPQPR